MTNEQKAVVLLDAFTKMFCIKDIEHLKFMCGECPFFEENGKCRVKIFKQKYYKNYPDFGSMSR